MGEAPRALLAPKGLRTWAIALLFSVLALAAAGLASIAAEANWKDYVAGVRAREVQAIESIPPVGERKGRAVIIFGTSLTEAAVQHGDFLPTHFPSSIQLVILTGQLGERTPIEDLVPVIRRVHPDLVLIEVNLMRLPFVDPPLMRRLRHLERAAFSWMWHAGADQDGCIGVVRRKSAKVGNIGEKYQRWNAPRRRLQLDRLPVLLDLQADGIQVGVLDLPRATELEVAAPNLASSRKTMGAALAEKDITFWAFPGYWPADYFCDLSHLDHDGAIVFDKLFSDRLRQALDLSQ
ncbi:MAG TPA: hypothetical protein VHQ39_06905 [Dongiaceae bacterium]|jgi:hypothetical protein|nr:hypothetical protein [Dongiaceae bacterium]